MSALLIAVHIIVCVALIMIVLLQTGKGADMGASFGGGSSQTLFGSTGASSFLGKATTAAAVIFMLTSLGLAYVSGNRPGGSSIMEGVDVPAATESAEEKAGGDTPADASAPVTEATETQESAEAETEEVAAASSSADENAAEEAAPEAESTAESVPAAEADNKQDQ